MIVAGVLGALFYDICVKACSHCAGYGTCFKLTRNFTGQRYSLGEEPEHE